MKKCYVEKKFSSSSLAIIGQANAIIDEYEADGMSLTLRQLYYQFVSRDLIRNKQSEYKRLGSIISDGRLAGLIDWFAIEDRTRNLAGNSHWTNPGSIIDSALSSYRIDRWEGQPYRPEVWIEKEALVGVIAPTCRKLDVDYMACKGYMSQSEMWSAARRQIYSSEIPVIIHLGDHDPSGIDMTRDIEDRNRIFDNKEVLVRRIALNYDQVERYSPPPNPAKVTDSRASGYIARHGTSSWELDALEPRVLRDLIEKTVLQYRDEEIYEERMALEREHKAILRRVANNWETL